MKFRTREIDTEITLVHHADARGIWATRGRHVLSAEALGAPWRARGSFPRDPLIDTFGIGRLPRRLLRADKCNLVPTSSGALLGIRQGKVYRMPGQPGQNAEPLFGIRGDSIMSRAIAEDADGFLYFGEYFTNPERVPVRILCVAPDLSSHRVAYEFDKPRPRHIHGVHADPFMPGRIWVTMGDFEHECYLAYTDDRFETMRFLGDGTQLWRMVGVLFQEERLCWLTDTHIEQNHIVSMDRTTEKIRLHGTRTASSWYAVECTDGRYLATTTVEPGPGIHTNEVHLLASEDGLDWTEVATFTKDPYPMRGFGFGSLWLPSGAYSSEDFWLSGEGVRGLDCHSQRCSIESAI